MNAINDFVDWFFTVDVDEWGIVKATWALRWEICKHFKPVEDIAYAPLNELSRAVGIPPDEIILVFGSIVTLMVCLLMPCIRFVVLRRAYNIFFGLFLGFFAYGAAFFLFIIYTVIGWAMMAFLSR